MAFIRNEHQLYLQARGQWAAAFHQSARYLSRPALEKRLLDLLAGTGSRVAQLHAMGGMGKTMQLRWLVARHCLMRRPPIPCAWIDFDAVDTVNAVHHPWLLLLRMAEQLHRQMVGGPFTELLRDHGRYLGVLSRSAEGSREALEAGAATAADAEDVVFRFQALLAELPSPVVLVLDTMEEVVLRPAGDLDAFVALFGRIHDRLGSRLVFSGRYDLASRLPGFAERFPDAPVIRVTGFDDTEAGRYLTGIRGVQDAELAAAIVRNSDGMPFTLALFADLAGDLTPDEVDQSEGPKLLYAIDRVLERIPDDRVRWLLRYGVVPRRLGYDFVRRVMWPRLLAGLSGASPYDTPDPDRDGRPRNRPTRIFLHAEDLPAQEDELRALWDRLASYAGASSWVSQDDPEVLTIHPNVRMPLRAMLRRHQVFGVLHEDALAYYQELARTDPARWQEWTGRRCTTHFTCADRTPSRTGGGLSPRRGGSAGPTGCRTWQPTCSPRTIGTPPTRRNRRCSARRPGTRRSWSWPARRRSGPGPSGGAAGTACGARSRAP